jgi:hypothetical protein
MREAILPLQQYVFMVWCLVKHRDNFTFYLTPANALEAALYFAVKRIQVERRAEPTVHTATKLFFIPNSRLRSKKFTHEPRRRTGEDVGSRT